MDVEDGDNDHERELLETSSFSQELQQEEDAVPSVPINSEPDRDTRLSKCSSCCSCYLSENTTVAEVFCLTLVLAFVFALFSAPIFIHFFLNVEVPASLLENSTSPNCITNMTVAWGQNTSSCTNPTPYSSGVCQQQLLNWHSCAIASGDQVFVNSSSLAMESNASDILSLINEDPDGLISSGCKQSAIPFICQYLFPICDVHTNDSRGDLLLPSQEECKNISEHTCETEWGIVKTLGYDNLLPKCETLPSNKSPSQGTPTTSPSDSTLTCAEGFFSNNGTCFPSCEDWNESGSDWAIALRVILLFSCSLVIMASTALFVMSFIRYKYILKYPSIYLVFMTLGFFIFATISIGGQTDRSKLFCRDDNILTSINTNPTLFCIIDGAAFHYIVLNATLWWFFHVCSIFFKMAFPLTAQRNKPRQLIVHLALTVLGFIAPIPGVVSAIVREDLQYIVSDFPPTLCVPRSRVLWFYSTMLPMDILIGVGISLLILILWLLHKYQVILKAEPHGSKLRLSNPEKKILIVLFFYAIFGVFVLAYFGVITDKSDNLGEAMISYFGCEATGYVPGKCSSLYESVQQHSLPYAVWFILLFLGLVPCVNLIFVVNWKFIKDKLITWKEQIDLYRTMSVNYDDDDLSSPHHTAYTARYRTM